MKLTIVALLVTFTLVPAQQAYLVDTTLDQLFTVDLATGAATLVGSTVPMTTPAGITHDGSALYSIDLGGGGFYTISTATGTPTSLGTSGLTGWQDIAWDPSTNQFFAVNQNDQLYTISATGTATLVASTTPATFLITAMAVDAAGTLWIMDFSSGTLGTMDKATGIVTTVGTSVNNVQGMGFHPVTGVLYASTTNTDSLYTINTSTAVATLIGAHGAGVNFAKGFCFAGTCTTALYQVNSAAADLNIDNVVGTACARAFFTRPQNTALTLNLLSTNAGLGFDLGITFQSLVPFGGGALLTPNNQIFNLNIGAPTLQFLFGGPLPTLSNPFPGSLSIVFLSPSAPVTVSTQMLILSPSSPDGFALSQAIEFLVQ